MPVYVKTFISKQTLVFDEENVLISDIKRFIHHQTKIPSQILRVSHQGRRVDDNVSIPNGSFVSVYSHLPGGKGGFGSMLRAIGAQIEKTTNREACRDLSGRRLRDINEEKRLKHWLAKQKEREAGADEKKREKLAKITQEPKHKFHDPDYDRCRSELADRITSAVEEGLKKTVQSDPSSKRKGPEASTSAKKSCMWHGFDEDLNESGTSSEEETETKEAKHPDILEKLESNPPLKEDEKDSKEDEKDSKEDEKDSKEDEKDSKEDEKDSKEDEKDLKEDEKDLKEDEKDLKEDKKDLKEDKKDLKEDKKDLKEDKKDSKHFDKVAGSEQISKCEKC